MPMLWTAFSALSMAVIALECLLVATCWVFIAALKPSVRGGLSTREHIAASKSSVSPLFAKPLLFLDVDGVINGMGGNAWPDKKDVKVYGCTISYSPTVVDKINSWSDGQTPA